MKTLNSILITGIICLNTYNLCAQNAPITTIGSVETYDDSTTVSIIVTDFIDIGACDLLITYDSTIASATSVSVGPGVGYMYFVPNTLAPGKISISWLFFQPLVSGLSLPDNSVFLNIAFERTGYGNSAIEFDFGHPLYCEYYDWQYASLNDTPNYTYYIDGSINFKMIDAPIINAPIMEFCEGTSSYIDVPVTVSEFNQIGAFNLSMQYNETVFNYESFTNDSGFPNLDVIESVPGTIVVEGISDATAGVTLANNSMLFTIHFENLGGSTSITWLDTGASCEFHGPAPMYEPRNDLPHSSFYENGSYTELPMPSVAGSISGPEGGNICRGDSNVFFSIAPIPYATGYEWELPAGAMIESGEGTPEIFVSFSIGAQNGAVNVYGTNECGNGNASPAFLINIETTPVIEIQPVSPDTVIAGDGTAVFSITATGSGVSYQWQEFTAADWSNIVNDEIYSGAMSEQLTITNPPIALNGNKYRCVVSGNCDPPAISDGNAILSVVLPTGYEIGNYNDEQGNNGIELTSFPNPFSDQITFTFVTPSAGIASIELFNMYGEKMIQETEHIETRGNHTFVLDGQQLSKGIYIAGFKFESGRVMNVKKLKIMAK